MNRSTPGAVGLIVLLGLLPWLGGFYDGILGIGAYWGVLTVNPTGYHSHLSLWGENAIFSWMFFVPYSGAVIAATVGALTGWRDATLTVIGLSGFVLISGVAAVALRLVPIGGLVAGGIIWGVYITTESADHSLEDPASKTNDESSEAHSVATTVTHIDSARKVTPEDYNDLVAELKRARSLANLGKYQKARARLNNLKEEISLTLEVAQEHSSSYESDLKQLERRRNRLLTRVNRRLQQRQVPDVVTQTIDISIEYAELQKEKLLGSGATADVFKTTTPTAHGSTTVAIKQPHVQGTLHTEAADRILSEAERWSKIDDHGHIVGVIDWGKQPLPWIAMEYLDGGGLGDRVGEMDTDQAVWTATKICDAVHHAHRNGVGHLDLKPENILFQSVADHWDIPKIADWGLSRHLLEQSHSVDGLTPQYAAPEQFDDEYGSVDDLTDIYQLGAVLYELFTGQPPFDGDQTAVMHSVLTEKPTPPSRITALPKQVDWIIIQCLSKQKSERFDSSATVRNKFEKILKNY